MKQQDLVQRLAKGIASATRSANFCVSGTLPNISPGLDVTGCGAVKLPLPRLTAKRLMSLGRQAPYGKGTKTLVNKKVRDSIELSPKQFKLTNVDWDETIRATVRSAAEQLGLPADRLEPQLYKLLVYGAGGMFLRHRDSEKSDRMVGSLIVALPTPFYGGALTVRHQATYQRMEFQDASSGKSPCFAAFYANCEHEVETVRHGHRLCLAYNLVLRAAPRGKKPVADVAETTSKNEIAQAISGWVAMAKSEPLVFALDHHYTQRGLSVDLLKGNDRATAKAIIAAAEEAGCRTYLCQVSRHVNQSADDGSWGHRWQDDDSTPDDLDLGEIIEDDLHGAEWVDIHGKKQPFPEIAFCTESIVASTPLDEWEPTQEEYEGYTGNAGNTLDRWYHRSALCVWHRDHHFDVIAKGGIHDAVEMLRPMVAKLKKTAKKRLQDAHDECIRFAKAIIGGWPKYHHHSYRLKADRAGAAAIFPGLLVEIGDPDLMKQLLTIAAPRDTSLDLGKLIVAICRQYGCSTIAGSLQSLFEANAGGLSERDVDWLAQLAGARFDDPTKDVLVAKLTKSAVEQFCQPKPNSYSYRDDWSRAESFLPTLLRTLSFTGDEPALKELIQFVTSQPKEFSIEKVQVPGLSQFVTWCRKQKVAVPPQVAAWLQSIEQQLSEETAHEPQPPTDWTRPATLNCSCRFCKELMEILADPSAARGRIAAPEGDRSHLINIIERNECDVSHRLEKTGRPFSLVLTKTNGSFKRRVQRYHADQKLLEKVNELLSELAEVG
jgi:hypothetical protein